MRAAEFVHSYLDAWNHHDARHVAEHFTHDGIYYDGPFPPAATPPSPK